MEIRLGKENDIDSWMTLVDKVKENFPDLETQEASEEHKNTVLEFIRKESAICAIVGTLLFSKENNMLCFLAVDAEYRRQHIAEKMVDKLKDDTEIQAGQEELFFETIRQLFFTADGSVRPMNLQMIEQVVCTETSENRIAEYLVDVLGDSDLIRNSLYLAKSKNSCNVLETLVLSKLEFEDQSNIDEGVSYFRVVNSLKTYFEEDFAYILEDSKRLREYLVSLLELYFFSYTAQVSLQLNRFMDGERDNNIPLYFRLEWEKTSQSRLCFTEGWQKLQRAIEKIFAHAITLEILNQTNDGSELVDYIRLGEIVFSEEKDTEVSEQIDQLTALYRASITDCVEMNELEKKSSPAGKTSSSLKYLFDSIRVQFENTGRIRAYGSYANKFESYCKRYLKSRGRSGLMLTLSEEDLIFITKLCIKNQEQMRLKDVFKGFERNLKRSTIQVFGITKRLEINPGFEDVVNSVMLPDGVYECRYNQTLNLLFDEETIDSDTGHIDCKLKFGSIIVPIQIQDEVIKPTELTGVGAFKRKFSEKKSLEYRNGKIIAGTKEFFTKEAFKYPLSVEDAIVKNEWLAVKETPNGLEEYPLVVTDEIRDAYICLLRAYKQRRSLPSLAYYNQEILKSAQQYVDVIDHEFSSIQPGSTLDLKQNHALLLGCVIKNFDEEAIAMSPVHPLNVMYQIALLNEEEVGAVRDNLIEKLTALYLVPFIKDTNKNLYQAIEQKHAPEWRYYAPISNKRYQGARNFIQKLVCDKITQYKEHFSFLFEDIGNNQLFINLVNMGDCREIFQGLLRFYAQNLKSGTDPDDLLNFVVNIYSENGMYNEFSLLSDQYKLKEFIRELYGSDDVSDLSLVMTGKIRCYFRNPAESHYQYAHLTFYEMSSAEDTGASRMDSITTGISLQGLTSGIPSVLNAEWYKTGFGTKYAKKNRLTRLATYYNAMYRVAFSGSSYEPTSCIFTEIEQGQEGQLGKIYASSNWVVFVDPKVDLSFFQKKSTDDDELMIIHYSDQYTSASGYDDITVTQKSDQYNEIIFDQLQKKGVTANAENINEKSKLRSRYTDCSIIIQLKQQDG